MWEEEREEFRKKMDAGYDIDTAKMAEEEKRIVKLLNYLGLVGAIGGGIIGYLIGGF